MIKLNFEQFTKSELKNEWIKEGRLEIYVRRTPEGYKDRWGDYQLASMTNAKPGKGALQNFLNKWERHYQFYIENVLNPRLVKFFLRRNYKIVTHETMTAQSNPPCMMGPDPKIIMDLFAIVKEYHSGDKDE
jgi:hypothetical protein